MSHHYCLWLQFPNDAVVADIWQPTAQGLMALLNLLRTDFASFDVNCGIGNVKCKFETVATGQLASKLGLSKPQYRILNPANKQPPSPRGTLTGRHYSGVRKLTTKCRKTRDRAPVIHQMSTSTSIPSCVPLVDHRLTHQTHQMALTDVTGPPESQGVKQRLRKLTNGFPLSHPVPTQLTMALQIAYCSNCKTISCFRKPPTAKSAVSNGTCHLSLPRNMNKHHSNLPM
uniref:Uncharacterized protein n=1 Tax=Panagrellus redivivus TaxID=6233 RepID=A0A7E4V5R7_PANRE